MDSQYLYVILFVSFNEILPPFQIIVRLTFFGASLTGSPYSKKFRIFVFFHCDTI